MAVQSGTTETPNIASLESTDYVLMKEDITLIEDIRAGQRQVKSKTVEYLPKYEAEDEASYNFRLETAPWRPEFVDGLNTLSSKPFTKTVKVNQDAPDVIQGAVVDEKTKRREGGFVDDVDGQGNNLHVFARETFRNGIADGLVGVLVDYPTMEPGLTLADERASGARPYWCEIRLRDLIALYFRKVEGHYVTEHMRVRESTRERNGFLEILINRIRVYELAPSVDPASGDPGGKILTISGAYIPPDKPLWELWESKTGENGKQIIELVGDGPITLDKIPVAWFWTGEKQLNSQYRVKPPLLDLANTQLELYRAGSRYDEIQTYAGSPMLKFTGMQRPQPTKNADGTERAAPKVIVGSKAVIFCPPAMEGVQSDADFIQPAAANIKEVREGVASIIADMQRMSLQPTLSRTGVLTATGSAIDEAKSHSAVEAWANGLRDTLELAFAFTCQWFIIPETITVDVFTDFGAGTQGVDEGRLLLDGAAPIPGKKAVLSGETLREEWSRRGLLGPQFDEERETQRLGEEQANDPLLQPQTVDPITGAPLAPGTASAGAGASQ